MGISRRSAIVLPLLVCATLLLGAEIAVRWTLPHYASRDFFLTLFGDPPDGTPKNQQPVFAGDPALFWRLRPNVDHAIWDFTVVSTNAQGLRHDRPVDARKPRGRFRIVCVGDSVTFGFRVPLVFPDAPDQYDRSDAPYPARLERMLRAEFPGRDVEVIALAVPGYSSHQGRILLEDTIGWLDPDVVVLCFGFNDVAHKHFPDHTVMARGFVPIALRTAMSSSQALLHTWRWWTMRPGPTPVLPGRVRADEDAHVPGPRVPLADYLTNLTAMADLAAARGAKVLVMGPVYRDRTTNPPEALRMNVYRSTLRDAMAAVAIPYLQIDELTEDSPTDNAPLFGEHVHPSSIGHQLMAERIFAALRDDGMLAPLVHRDAAS